VGHGGAVLIGVMGLLHLNRTPPVRVIPSVWRRIVGALIVAISLLGLASFSAGAAPPIKGTVIGKAVPCSGPMYVPTSHLSVFRGAALVAAGRFRSGSTFRFVLPPGRYVITDNRADPAGGTHFRIRAGRLAHVVVIDGCS
jgi:hypothetical protein